MFHNVEALNILDNEPLYRNPYKLDFYTYVMMEEIESLVALLGIVGESFQKVCGWWTLIMHGPDYE